MTAATGGMYRRLPDGDWLSWMPEHQAKLVQVPEWATDCMCEGWSANDYAWLEPTDESEDATLDFYFSLALTTKFRAWGPDDAREPHELEIELKRWDSLIRHDGVYRYDEGAPRIVFRIDDGDAFQVDVSTAQLLLEQLGAALTPALPSTVAEVRAERRRNLVAAG